MHLTHYFDMSATLTDGAAHDCFHRFLRDKADEKYTRSIASLGGREEVAFGPHADILLPSRHRTEETSCSRGVRHDSATAAQNSTIILSRSLELRKEAFEAANTHCGSWCLTDLSEICAVRGL
jgi:hypothetical protein